MPDLYYDFVYSTVAASVTAGDTTITLADVSTFPSNTQLAKGYFYVTFDSPLTYPNTFDTVQVLSVNSGAKTIAIASPGAASAHSIGTYVKGTLTAQMIRNVRAGLSGTSVPALDNTIYEVGDQFLLTTSNQLYSYTSTGFVQVGGSARATATATTASLAPAASDATTTLSLSYGYSLYSIETSLPARVRLYATTAARTADALRVAGADPSSSAGVVLDYITLLGSTVYDLSPVVRGANLESSPTTNIAMTVTNLSPSTTTAITVTAVWLKEE